MHSLLQFASTKRVFKTTFITLALMLMLMGGVLSLSGFTQSHSTLAQSPYRAHKIGKLPDAGCFPNNAVWTWVSPDGVFQAWIGPIEYPKHFNFHVSPVCAPDTANYHISYIGNGIWRSYDSVANKTANYGSSGVAVCDSLGIAASEQANAAAVHVYNADKNSLIGGSYSPLWEMMNLEIGGVCG
jgi:di/tricarboxylate transporter